MGTSQLRPIASQTSSTRPGAPGERPSHLVLDHVGLAAADLAVPVADADLHVVQEPRRPHPGRGAGGGAAADVPHLVEPVADAERHVPHDAVLAGPVEVVGDRLADVQHAVGADGEHDVVGRDALAAVDQLARPARSGDVSSWGTGGGLGGTGGAGGQPEHGGQQQHARSDRGPPDTATHVRHAVTVAAIVSA
nr:hypothetical protein [Actinomadura madurae]